MFLLIIGRIKKGDDNMNPKNLERSGWCAGCIGCGFCGSFIAASATLAMLVG